MNFGKFGSLTAWVDQLTEDAEEKNARLVTFWHLTKNVKDAEEPTNLWATVLTGSAIFTRTEPGSKLFAGHLPSHPVNLR